MVITDSDGAFVEAYDYDPYGAPTIRTVSGIEISASTIGNTIMFTGREYDYETGLYYFRARTMHPAFGRFMQHDPLMYVDGLDFYEYVGGNPIAFIDNKGLSNSKISPITSIFNRMFGKGYNSADEFTRIEKTAVNQEKASIFSEKYRKKRAKGAFAEEGTVLVTAIIAGVISMPFIINELKKSSIECSNFDWISTKEEFMDNYAMIKPWGEFTANTMNYVEMGLAIYGAYIAYSAAIAGGSTILAAGGSAASVLAPVVVPVVIAWAIGTTINAGLNSKAYATMVENISSWAYDKKYGPNGIVIIPEGYKEKTKPLEGYVYHNEYR